MKSFKNYIKEDRIEHNVWGKSSVFEILAGNIPRIGEFDGYYVPLNPSVIAKIFAPRSARALHIFGSKNAHHLLRIQGTRNAISTTPSISDPYPITTGIVGGNGGLVAVVRGNLLVAAQGDIMTVIDGNGRRWISVNELFEAALFGDVWTSKNASIIRAQKKRFSASIDTIRRNLMKKYVAQIDIMTKYMNWQEFMEVIQKAREDRRPLTKQQRAAISKLVEDYINQTGKLLERFATEMNEVIFKALVNPAKNDPLISEWIMDNIKIEKVFVIKESFGDIETAKKQLPKEMHAMLELVGVQDILKKHVNELR